MIDKRVLNQFLCLFLSLPILATASETYRWVDNSGQIHFSDRLPLRQTATSVSLQQIETTKFSKLNSKSFKPKKRKKYRKRQAKAVSHCKKLKQQIAKIETQLSKRQSAKDFDKNNKLLVALRWQKIKNC